MSLSEKNLIEAGYPYLAVATAEPRRLDTHLCYMTHNTTSDRAVLHVDELGDVILLVWDETNRAVNFISSGVTVKKATWVKDVFKACLTLLGGDSTKRNGLPSGCAYDKVMVIVHDASKLLQAPGAARTLSRDIGLVKDAQITLVFSDPSLTIPDVLKHDVTFFDFKLPSPKQREAVILDIISAFRADVPQAKEVELTADVQLGLVNVSSGMALEEVENALSYALVKVFNKHGLSNELVRAVFDLKISSICATGFFEYIESNVTFADIGGHEGMKEWVQEQNVAMDDANSEFDLPPPKGMLIVGFPATGKTEFAKAWAGERNAPLFLLKVDALTAGVQGQTESNYRTAMNILENMGESVVLLDELDKSLNKTGLEGHNASSANQKGFGALLTWLQERRSGAYLIGTANSLQLSSALLRKGRWDEMFFADYPDADTRKQIVDIKVRKHNLPGTEDTECYQSFLEFAARETNNWSGGELGSMIVSAVRKALVGGQLKPNGSSDSTDWMDVAMDVIANTQPLYNAKKAEFDAMKTEAMDVMRLTTIKERKAHGKQSGKSRRAFSIS